MKKLAFAVLVFALFLSGCSLQPTVSNECIPPVVAATPPDMGIPHPKPETHILLEKKINIPSWWKIQPDWWRPFQEDTSDEGIWAIAARNRTVWVALSFRILRYDSENGQSHFYEIKDENNQAFGFRDIFFTKDGELWALVSTSKTYEYITLAHYNFNSDQFELVPALKQEGLTGNGVFFVDSEVLAETPDGKLLMPLDKNIVSYDPHQKTIQHLLPQDFSLDVAALAISENKVWFTVGQDMDLRSVDLQTGELVNYSHAPSILDEAQWEYYMVNAHGPIAIDGQGSVWAGYFARLKKDQNGQYTWEQVSYPPEFVFEDVVDPYSDSIEYQYEWADLFDVQALSDGSLWFNSQIGLVQYDPEKNRWCKSISISPLAFPPIMTEDNQGNVWMAVMEDQHINIYMYNLYP